MAENKTDNKMKFEEDQRHYIEMLQDVINRMANNSANCKTWLLTIVAAVIALAATTTVPADILWILLGLDVIFYLMDVAYLAQEKKFRTIERKFVLNEAKIYSYGSDGEISGFEMAGKFFGALISWSTWPLYGGIAIAILIIKFYMLS